MAGRLSKTSWPKRAHLRDESLWMISRIAALTRDPSEVLLSGRRLQSKLILSEMYSVLGGDVVGGLEDIEAYPVDVVVVDVVLCRQG